MKKIILLFYLVFISTLSGFSQITWMGNEYMTSGTHYLGDNVLFEIQSYPIADNQGTQVYIDWNNDGYGSTSNVDYFSLSWSSNNGNNSVWNRYVTMSKVGTHNRKYLGWQTGKADCTPANMGTFVVSELNNPSANTPFSVTSSSVNLEWTKDAQNHNVMIVRKLSSESWTEPTQGTAYVVGNSIGNGVVIYNGNATAFSSTDLLSSTEYDYKFYSENNSYYSSGITISVTTATSSTDYFRSRASGNWNLASNWESSSNNSSWLTSTLVPNSSATAITILEGHSISIGENATATELIINAGGMLTLSSGKTLGITNLTIKSNVNATGTFVDYGTTTISGTSNVQQYYTTARQWWYVSSPVSGAVSAVFNPEGTNKLGYWDESNCTYPQITNNSTALTVGKGYLAKLTGSNGIYTFTGGALNTGDITLNPAPTRTGTENLARGYNLVGNPYPSFLDWNNASNVKTNLRPTIWYRTANSSNEMVFDTFDGSVGTHLGANGLVSRYIPPMQAFWVKVDADGQTAALTFSNSARLHCDQSSATNRLRAPQKSATTLPIVRLIVSNGVNSDEAILVADENAADVFDNYDSPKMSNNNASIAEIFTLAGSEQLVINHLNNFDIDKQIALGFRTATNNTFSINASELSNIDNQTKVVLIDRLENEEFDLSNGQSYNFSANASTTTDRFVVAFRAPGSVTKIANTTLNNQVLAYANENRQIVLKINGDTKVTYNVTVCNSVGQVILNKNVTQNNSVIDKQLTSGVYMVSINDNANTVTKRIIIN